MIFAGTIGQPAIGTLQDVNLSRAVAAEMPEVHSKIVKNEKGQFFDYQAIDPAKLESQPEATRQSIATIKQDTKQLALADIAFLPAIMCVCYLILIVYFQARGGYKAQVLVGHAAEDEKFTGGTIGPGQG
jgi:hypothetical protein